MKQNEIISAVNVNSGKSASALGDIRTSILSLSQFQSLEGICWIKLNDNSVADIDISGSDLEGLLGSSILKSAAGRVLRGEGGLSSTLGQTQEDAFQGHHHQSVGSDHAGNGGQFGPGQPGRHPSPSLEDDFITYPISDGVNGTPRISSETRSKNLTVNMFIKINNACP